MGSATRKVTSLSKNFLESWKNLFQNFKRIFPLSYYRLPLMIASARLCILNNGTSAKVSNYMKMQLMTNV